jgi:hypothetical protein
MTHFDLEYFDLCKHACTEEKPGKWLLRKIPAQLPELAVGQRWAKGYYTQALHQNAKVVRHDR